MGPAETAARLWLRYFVRAGTDRDMRIQQEQEELQQRVCRVCHQRYRYPVLKSPATRFHCEACVALPAAVRGVLEKQGRRLKELTVQVEQLERDLRRLEGRK